MPTEGYLISTWVNTGIPGGGACHNIAQWMSWDNSRRMAKIRDSGNNDTRAYEHEAQFGGEVSDYGTTTANNIPNYYMDTDLDDPPTQFTRAGGSWHSQNLNPDTFYYFELKLIDDSDMGAPGCPPPIGPPFVQTGVHVASQRSFLNGPCWPTHAYCVTGLEGWPRDIVPSKAGWVVLPYDDPTQYYYTTNQLDNPSFEDGSGVDSWGLRPGDDGSANWAVYSGGAFEDSQYVQYNCAGTVSGCSVYQDVVRPVRPDDYYNERVGLRCRAPSGQSCGVTVALWALQNGLPNVSVSRTYSIAADSGWVTVAFKARDWPTREKVRFEIYNNSPSKNLDVDFATVHWSDIF
jgi:hypothetical protein